MDFKVREQESILVIKKDTKVICNHKDTDLGLSPAELFLLSAILHVRQLLQRKEQKTFNPAHAGNKPTQKCNH